MMHRGVVTLLILAVVAVPTSAQFVVIDPGNLAQAVLIAQRAQQVYEQLQTEYELILRMSQGLANLNDYRMPSIVISALDAARFPYGRSWIEGMNGGDPRGAAYFASAVPLQRPEHALDRLGAAARRQFESRYATVEISDSVAMMGGHQVAVLRGYHGQLQRAVESLQDDVMNGSRDFHQLTAVLDKISAGELLGRRQDMAANQLLSHALEQLLTRNKRERDTEAAAINMQLTSWRDGRAANEAFVAGTGDALRVWRQP
jgi:conjugal transfer/entry exclusion protein